jgi:ArsR family transcriptional regulator, virulence genes transcriptional regulator
MNKTNFENLKVHAAAAAKLLKLLSNENRLMILCALIEAELSVSELNALLPLSQSALSQHLSALREKKLVVTRRDAQTIYYSSNGTEANKVIAVLKEIYCP